MKRTLSYLLCLAGVLLFLQRGLADNLNVRASALFGSTEERIAYLQSQKAQEQEEVYIIDSITLRNGQGVLTSIGYSYYNELNQEVSSTVVNVDASGVKVNHQMDSAYYDENGNLKLYKVFMWEAGDWIPSRTMTYFTNEEGRVDSTYAARYDKDLAEWKGLQRMVYEYGENGELLKEIFSDPVDYQLDVFVPFFGVWYENFVNGNPLSAKGIYYKDLRLGTLYNYTYDNQKNRISEESKRISINGADTVVNFAEKDEWKYNADNKVIENIYSRYLSGAYSPRRKSVYTYDEKGYNLRDTNYNIKNETLSIVTSYEYFWKLPSNNVEPEDTACEAPVNVSVTSITASSAVISWESKEPKFIITYIEKGEDMEVKNEMEVEGKTTETLTGLKANTNYTVKIKAVRGEKVSDYSEEIIFKTLETTANENLHAHTFHVYPNPNAGLFRIETESEISVEIYNLSGIRVRQMNLYAGVHAVQLKNSGVYFLKVKDKETRKVAIQKLIVR